MSLGAVTWNWSRPGLECCGEALDLPLERVDRPRMHLAVADRQEPAVRAIERLELGRARECGDTVRDHRRRRLGCVVAHSARNLLGRRSRQHERRERRVRLQRRAANLDQVQVRRRRDRAAALQAQHLAVRRDAARGQPTGDELHPLAQVIGGADVDEPPLNRRFAEEHRGDRLFARERAHLRCDLRVELREAADCAAPDDLHGPVARLELSHRELELAVLHDEPPG